MVYDKDIVTMKDQQEIVRGLDYTAIINDLEWPYAKFRAPGPGEVEP